MRLLIYAILLSFLFVSRAEAQETRSAVSGTGKLTNSIVWDNKDKENVNLNQQVVSGIVVSYSCILNRIPVPGDFTISVDPKFGGLTDFRLSESSPCKNKGNNQAVSGIGLLVDLADTVRRICQVDMGAYEFPQERLNIRVEPDTLCFDASRAEFPFSYVRGNPDKYSFGFDPPVADSVRETAFPASSPFSTGIPEQLEAGNYPGELVLKNTDGCIDTFNMLIVVHPIPKAKIGQNDTICKGDTATLKLTFEGRAPFTYKITGGNATSKSETGYVEIPVSPSDTMVYKILTFKDENQCGLSPANYKDTAEIIVRKKPDITGVLAAPAPVCDGEELSVDVPEVSWNDSDSTASGWILNGVDFTAMPHPVTYADNGKILKYWVQSECGLDTIKNGVVVNVNPKPSVDIIKNDTICVEANSGKVLFENPKGNPVKYSLNFENPAFIGKTDISPVGYPIVVDIVLRLEPGVKYDGELSLVSNLGCKDTIDVSIVTDSIPTAKISRDQTVCLGSDAVLSVVFTGKAPFTYRITGDVADRTSISDTAQVKVSPGSRTAYYVTAFSDANNCGLSPVITKDSAVVNISKKPEFTGTQENLQVLCEGGELPLQTVDADIFGWPLGATHGWAIATTKENNEGMVGITAPYQVKYADHNHYLKYWVENGCGKAVTEGVRIMVDPQPKLTALITPAPVCSGTDLNMAEPSDERNTAITGKGWIFGSGTPFSMPGQVIYTDNGKPLKFWAQNACGTDTTNMVIITVNDKPQNEELTSPVRLCAGVSLQGIVPVTDWKGGESTGSGWVLESPGSRSDMLPQYQVMYADNGGSLKYWTRNACGADTTVGVILRVDDKPELLRELGVPVPICDGLNMVLTSIPARFNGSDSTGFGWLLDGVAFEAPYTISYGDNGKGLQYWVENGCGRDMTAEAGITVNPLPVVQMGPDTVVCKGSSVPVRFRFISGTAPFTYHFSGLDADRVTADSYESITLLPEKTTAFTITSLKDNNGCEATGAGLADSMLVKVATSPVVNDFMNQLTLCQGRELGAIPVWDDKNDSIVNGGWIIDNVPVVPEYKITYADSGRILRIWGENMCGRDSSNGIAMQIKDKPVVASLSDIAPACSGTALAATVPVINDNGAAITKMEWLLDNLVFDIKKPVSHTDSGRIVRFRAGNYCGTDTTNGRIITVYSLPEGFIGGSSLIEWGDTTNLELSFKGISPYTYRISGDTIDRVSSGVSTFIPVSPKVTTSYRVTVLSDAHGCIADPANLHGTAIITLIEREPFVFTISDTLHVYDGSEKRAHIYIHPADLAYTVTYDGGNTAPVNAGEYNVIAEFPGSKRYEPAVRKAVLTIEKAPLYIDLETDDRYYNGKPQPAGIVLHPQNIPVRITYNNVDTVPVAIGDYWVIVVSADPNYEGQAEGRLRILPGRSYEIINTVQLSGDNNTYFMIRRCEEFTEVKVMFFDRLGRLMYKSEAYHNDYDMRNLEAGTYYYVLTYKDEEGGRVSKKGAVTVIK